MELMNLGDVFLGVFFLLLPIEIAVRFAVAASSQNYEFGGSISPSYISIIFVEDETSDQPKIHLWSFL